MLNPRAWAGVGCAAGAAYFQADALAERSAVLNSVLRAGRAVRCVGGIALDYQRCAEQRLAPPHQRSAERLLALCRRNRGCYIKFAQHAAQLDFLLPPAYAATLRPMLAECPQSTAAQARRVIAQELGAPVDELFDAFEDEPIASASLAQVHVARERGTGRKLAVKVQHEGLDKTSDADVWLVQQLTAALASHFPEWGERYRWIGEELAPKLPLELDFRLEAANANRCAAHLGAARNGIGGGGGGGAASSVCVPRLLPSLSSKRVLTMTFEDGVSVADGEAIEAMGLRRGAVAALLSETFCRLVFEFGDVHADPHPANVLVRRGAGGAPQLVLLDHGLYQALSDDFRLDYARLWRAIVFADVEEIERRCQKLNAGAMYPLLAAMLTARPWDDISSPDLESLRQQPAAAATGQQAAAAAAAAAAAVTAGGASASASAEEQPPLSDEDQARIGQYAAEYAGEITKMLGRVPRQMLLLFKVNDCLRHADRQLGAPVNTFLITARACTAAIAAAEAAERAKAAPASWASALRTRFTSAWAMLMLELRILLVRVASAVEQLGSEQARRQAEQRRQQRLAAHEAHLQSLIER